MSRIGDFDAVCIRYIALRMVEDNARSGYYSDKALIALRQWIEKLEEQIMKEVMS